MIGSFTTSYKWKISAIKDGKSYLWNNLYSKPFTKVQGLVGCWVTSKKMASDLLKEIGRTTSISNVFRSRVYREAYPRSRLYSMARQRCTKIPLWEQDVYTTGLTWWLTWDLILLCIMVGSLAMPGYLMPGSRIGSQTSWKHEIRRMSNAFCRNTRI